MSKFPKRGTNEILISQAIISVKLSKGSSLCDTICILLITRFSSYVSFLVLYTKFGML